MSIPALSGSNPANEVRKAEIVKQATAQIEKDSAAVKENPKDTFQKTEKKEESVGYSKPKGLSADQLKALNDQQVESFKNMLSSMAIKQGNMGMAAKPQLTKDFMSKLNVTPEQSAKAAQAISEDGEWGVKAVAGRIMDMAVALSGGDSSKIETLKNAVLKGFGEAGKQWGGELPDITSKTKDEIMKRFDHWEKNGSLDGYSMD